jgi:hypothetical protein
MKAAAALLVLLAPTIAAAQPMMEHLIDVYEDPCGPAVIDPIVTPVRDVDLDAQRSACLRRDISVRLLGHALIDTPGFHGVLGGDLALAGHFLARDWLELSAQLRVVDFTFVQNAVNMATNTGFGPLVVGAALGTGGRSPVALVAQLELPYTRDNMDTLRTSGQLAVVVTSRLADSLLLHGRLGALGMHAESLAGSTNRLALRAGGDVAWRLRTRLALHAGADISAGWYHGFDHVLLRAGVHWQPTATDWRLRAGVGAPLGGSERTNAVLDVAIVHGL